jgi:hypothetical protein
MLAETVGASIRAPVFNSSSAMSLSSIRKQMAGSWIADVEGFHVARRRGSDKECVVGVGTDPGLGREHVDPTRRSTDGPEPGVGHADGNHSAGPGHEGIGAAVKDQRRLAFEDEKAFFERVHVGVDVAAGLQRAQSQPHVNGADRSVDERGTAERSAALGVGRRGLDVRGLEEMVHACAGLPIWLLCIKTVPRPNVHCQ